MDSYQLASYVAVEIDVHSVVEKMLCMVDDAAKLRALMDVRGPWEEHDVDVEVEESCQKSSTCFLEPGLYLKR